LLPLRYPRLWVAVGWLLVAAVVVGSLVPGPALRAVSWNDKVTHAGSYFLLMVWFAGLYGRRRHIWIALGLLALGLALDSLQLTTKTRHFDLRDVAANGFGILAGLTLSVWLLEGWCQRIERLLLAPERAG
jgi:VanZ family protein